MGLGYIIGGSAILVALTTGWGLLERNGKLNCAIKLEKAQVALQELGERVKDQNARVEEWKAQADSAQKDAAKARREADVLRGQFKREREGWREVLAGVTPLKQDGSQAGCDDAWGMIERKIAK